MKTLGNELIGIGLKLKGGNNMAYQAQLKKDARDYSEGDQVKFWIPAKLSGNDIVVYWNAKLLSDGSDPANTLKEGSWIEFDGYSKNGKSYTAKQLKVVDDLEALADDNLDEDTSSPITKTITKSLNDQLRSGDMVRVRAVNDAMLDKEMPWLDKLAYVKMAVNLYSASTMDDSEVSAEYDDKGQRIPF
tara:strand:- start:1348 stop:1914 length:567 start_codon:yes stop_codon:yes gene_type:complete